MNKGKFFITNFILSALRFAILLIISVAFYIIGAVGYEICIYIGTSLLIIYFLICLISAIHMQNLVNYRSDDDPEFNEMMDALATNPQDFLAEIIEDQEQNKSLRGEELLGLSDEDLFETVFFQNIDIEEAAGDEPGFNAFTGARRTVYILSTFDTEIQNGGLCQFFVNSSKEVAPFVSECLEMAGAYEHRKLFDKFISENDINLSELSSFNAKNHRSYIKQTKRFPFNDFDNSYCDLLPLQNFITAYIRTNINEF